MRVLTPLLCLLLGACGWVEQERQEAAQAARLEATSELSATLSGAIRRAEANARSAERILRPMPVASLQAEAQLRRFRNNAHVERARSLGVRVSDDPQRDSLLAGGGLVQLEDSTRYWIVRRGVSPAYVLPQTESMLELLGERFQARLDSLRLPRFRLEVTSALRTTEHQRRLARVNTNAARGASSHEYGTTVDLSYAAFAPPAAVPDDVMADLSSPFSEHVHRFQDLALESVSARKSRELGGILTQVLTELQNEGRVLVIHERQQTVYHLTVAR